VSADDGENAQENREISCFLFFFLNFVMKRVVGGGLGFGGLNAQLRGLQGFARSVARH
jgi:hypothetical protein